MTSLTDVSGAGLVRLVVAWQGPELGTQPLAAGTGAMATVTAVCRTTNHMRVAMRNN